jgi:hypothetical protein
MFAEKPLKTPDNPSALIILKSICNISHLFNRLNNLACRVVSLFVCTTSEEEGRSSLGKACNLVLTVSNGYTTLSISFNLKSKRKRN